MTLHTERTVLQPVTVFASADACSRFNRRFREVLFINAVEGNANVTIVEDDMTEVCLFATMHTFVGVSLAYRTQMFAILSQQETIDYFNYPMSTQARELEKES